MLSCHHIASLLKCIQKERTQNTQDFQNISACEDKKTFHTLCTVQVVSPLAQT